jgi:hypothetical protein
MAVSAFLPPLRPAERAFKGIPLNTLFRIKFPNIIVSVGRGGTRTIDLGSIDYW